MTGDWDLVRFFSGIVGTAEYRDVHVEHLNNSCGNSRPRIPELVNPKSVRSLEPHKPQTRSLAVNPGTLNPKP